MMRATRNIMLYTIFLSLTTTQVLSTNLAFHDGYVTDNLASKEKWDKVGSETSQLKKDESALKLAKIWKLLLKDTRVERVDTPKNKATARIEEEERKLDKLTRSADRENTRDQFAPLRRLKEILSQDDATLNKREPIPRRCRCRNISYICIVKCKNGRRRELPQEKVDEHQSGK